MGRCSFRRGAFGLPVSIRVLAVIFSTIVLVYLMFSVVTTPYTIELQVTAVKEEVSIEEINEYFVVSDIALDDKNIICTLTPDKEHYREVSKRMAQRKWG